VRAPLPPAPAEPENGFFEYPLFKEDVHYMIRCSALLKPEVTVLIAVWIVPTLSPVIDKVPFAMSQFITDAAGFTVAPKKRNIFSMPVGPVEPGPPAVRVCVSVAVCVCVCVCVCVSVG
jgi:hypothetical protein